MPASPDEGSAISSQPCPAGNPALSKKPPDPACARPSSGTVGLAPPSICRNVPPDQNESKLSPVASRILDRLSVDGQRSRPSLLTRLETLNAVASRPASL